MKLKKINQGYLLNVPKKSALESKNFLREKYGVTKPYVISYCGGVTQGRNIEEIIQAYSAMDQTKSQLLIVGSISDKYKHELTDLLIKYGIQKNTTLTGAVENRTLKEYMRLSDITFTLYKQNSLNNRFSSPNKIFDAIHAEVYFIASESPLIHDITSKYKVGEIVKHVTPENLKKHLSRAIINLKTVEPSTYEKLKNKYCWETEEVKIKDIISKI